MYVRLSVLSILLVGLSISSAQAQSFRTLGTRRGAIVGATFGGIIGGQNDEVAAGILAGGLIGAATGRFVGNRMDQRAAAQYSYPQHSYSQNYSYAQPQSGYTYNGYSNQSYSNQSYSNQGYSNRVYSNQGYYQQPTGGNYIQQPQAIYSQPQSVAPSQIGSQPSYTTQPTVNSQQPVVPRQQTVPQQPAVPQQQQYEEAVKPKPVSILEPASSVSDK
jgi:hypothetical protein